MCARILPRRRCGAAIAAASVFVLFASAADASGASVNTPPVLESFGVLEAEEGVYTVHGSVGDEYPEGCYVAFGGSLLGYFALVNHDGSFSLTVAVGYAGGGPVSAAAIDDAGQESNVRWDDIQ